MIGQADACFDVLSIVGRLGTVPEGVMEGEVHMIAYLGFLLSLYTGEASERWGYRFATTPSAAPFSDAINAALESLRRVGLIAIQGPALLATAITMAELANWRVLPRNAHREPYVRAAAEAAAQVSLPTLARGLNREPQLQHAARVGGMRALPDDLAEHELKQHFTSINHVFGGPPDPVAATLDDDLMVRAALWLDYLSTNARDAA